MACARAQLLYLSAVLNAAFAQGVYTTTVTPRADDDISAPCQYELTLPQNSVAVRAVWVIFDRGREVADLYNDPAVFRFADKERIGLLLPRHCRSKERDDMDVDPAKGLGRALFQALNQLAGESQHGELESAKVIVFGFSGAGSLSARMPGFAPDRVLAAIDYAPGQYDPLGMDTIELTPKAASVPQLIIANGADPVNGTKRPFEFFRKYHDRGSPWVLAIQNGVPHHGGLANAKPLIFAWIENVLDGRPGPAWSLYLKTAPSSTVDEWKNAVDRVAEVRIEKTGSATPEGYMRAGEMVSHKLASEWLAFVKRPVHKVNTKYP
jgi:dienelactone hydrolase